MVYIELKTLKGSLSKSQKLWQNVSNALNTPHYIFKGEINDLDQIKVNIKGYNLRFRPNWKDLPGAEIPEAKVL